MEVMYIEVTSLKFITYEPTCCQLLSLTMTLIFEHGVGHQKDVSLRVDLGIFFVVDS